MRRWWFALMLLMMPALQVWAAGPPATEGMTPAMADRFKAPDRGAALPGLSG